MKHQLGAVVWLLLLVGASAFAATETNEVGDSTSRTTSFVDKLELVAMLKAGEFVELEKILTTYQEDFEAAAMPEAFVENAFLAFVNSDPELRNHLDQWVSQMPESYAAIMARGIYYWHVGSVWRGSGWAKDTHKTRFAKMREFFQLAVEDFGQAIEINDKLSVAYSALISIAMATGSGRATEKEILELGLTAVPGSAAIRYRYLHALWWDGKLEEIKGFVDEIIPLTGEFPELRVLGGYYDFAVGDRFRQQGKSNLAIQYYERALEHGEHWWYRFRHASVLHGLKQYDAALEVYDLAARARPQMTDVLNWKATVLRRLDRYDEAFEVWQEALELDPFKPPILLNMSYALVDKERYDEALAALDKALVYGSLDVDVRYARGYLLLYWLERSAESLDDLRFTTEFDPENQTYWYHYGNALYRLRDCATVDALKQMLRVCDAKKECREKDIEWANYTIRFMSQPWVCLGQFLKKHTPL